MLPKLQTETRNNLIVKKILEMRELFYKTSKEKVKRLHLPTGESPLAKKVCGNKDSEQSAPVAKRGLVCATSRGENVTRSTEQKTGHFLVLYNFINVECFFNHENKHKVT